MPSSQIEHLKYTKVEWTTLEYFKNILNILSKNKIKNYIDLGANVGGVCDVILSLVDSIEVVYLFEPQKDNFKFLQNRFATDHRVKLYNYGIFYGEKQPKVYRCDDNVGGYTLVNKNESFIQHDDIFICKTLEMYNFENPDFIKIDVEGSEYNILENSTLVKKSRFLEIEFHDSEIDLTIAKCLPSFKIIDKFNNNVFLEILL